MVGHQHLTPATVQLLIPPPSSSPSSSSSPSCLCHCKRNRHNHRHHFDQSFWYKQQIHRLKQKKYFVGFWQLLQIGNGNNVWQNPKTQKVHQLLFKFHFSVYFHWVLKHLGGFVGRPRSPKVSSFYLHTFTFTQIVWLHCFTALCKVNFILSVPERRSKVCHICRLNLTTKKAL